MAIGEPLLKADFSCVMGGSRIDGDLEFNATSNAVSTLLLFGRTGMGKSETGNSVLGRKGFKSSVSSNAVTTTCEMQSTVLKDGNVVNVIDTSGLFYFEVGSDYIVKEIVKTMDLAKDGIHAVLLVFSVKTRFSREEEVSFQSLQTFFGDRITDYMIVVFTGADKLEDNEMLKDYLGCRCPETLQKILQLCKNRVALFDNKTKDETKRAEQVRHLLSLVNMVIAENGGRPYSNEFFVELKKGAARVQNQKEEVESLKGCGSYDEHVKRITEMVELKQREDNERLEQELALIRAAVLEREKNAQMAQIRSLVEILKNLWKKALSGIRAIL